MPGPRFLLALATILLGLLAAPAAHAAAIGDWNPAAQRAVAGAGLLAPLADGRFHGERELSAAELRAALNAIAARRGTAPVNMGGSAEISVMRFDARLVAQLGLADVARHVQRTARRAGLRPRPFLGSEVVARHLGLRYNHPAPDDALELYADAPITRAQAAHSLARVLGFSGWEVADARAKLGAFALPPLAEPARRALRLALGKVGMPYVWGGETDAPSTHHGLQVSGGYDCSGFAWRVFKLSGDPAGAAIRGRTAAQQAGEIPRAQRIPLEAVQPGDLLFFGSAGFAGDATEAGIDHMGIALSSRWMVHSSSQGVYVSSLEEPWRRARFAWARRIL